MCFSAAASFTAGTALVAVGGVTVHRSEGPIELPVAMVPLLFGVQQLTEGFLWLSFEHDWPVVQSWTTYIFSVFSHVVWPIFIPFAILLVETSRWRRRALGGFEALGLSVGLYLLSIIVRFPVTATVYGNSIFYDTPHLYSGVVLAGYLLATCVSGLFSSHRCMNAFGILAFVLAVAAYQVEAKTFISVWCFFAAVMSLLVFIHFSGPMQSCRPALASSREAARAGRRDKTSELDRRS